MVKEKIRIDAIDEMIKNLQMLKDGTIQEYYKELDDELDDDESGDIEKFIIKIYSKLQQQKMVIMHRLFYMKCDDDISVDMAVDRVFTNLEGYNYNKYDILNDAEEYFFCVANHMADIFEFTPSQFVEEIVFSPDFIKEDCASEDTVKLLHEMLDHHANE